MNAITKMLMSIIRALAMSQIGVVSMFIGR